MPLRHATAVIALTALTVGAQTDARFEPGFDLIRADHLRANLTFLASDALEGRLSLARGSEVTIEWLASEFAKAGLKPAAGNSYFQPVPLIEYRGDRNDNSLTLERGGKSKTFRPPDGGGGDPYGVNLKAPLVFAGYGITAPEFGYDDYAGIDVRGRIVLVFDREPQDNDPKSIFNGLGNTRYANVWVKERIAMQHGAIALMMSAAPSATPLVEKPAPKAPAQPRQSAVPMRTPRPQQALDDREHHLPTYRIATMKMLNELLAPTGHTALELREAIDKDLKPASTLLADTVVTMHCGNVEWRRAASRNVVGLLEGSDPVLKNETILVTAHYDHEGVDGNLIFHGADDNGSGTVGVVELAHAFGANRVHPRRSILFAVFAAEERGLLGSFYYADHPLRPLATTRAVINFDMIGRNEAPTGRGQNQLEISADTSNEINLVGTTYSPDYRRTVEEANQKIGLKLNYKFDEKPNNVLFRSDHFPFVLKDIPAFWWLTGFHPDYHQVTDTADRINYEKMEKILRLAYLTGWEFAEGNPPKFVARTQ